MPIRLRGIKRIVGDYDALCEMVKTIEEAVLNMKPAMGVMLIPGHLKEANISANVKCIDLADSRCYFTISLCHHPENNNPLIGPFVEHYLKLSIKGECD